MSGGSVPSRTTACCSRLRRTALLAVLTPLVSAPLLLLAAFHGPPADYDGTPGSDDLSPRHQRLMDAMLGAAPPDLVEGGGWQQREGATASVPDYLKFFAATDSKGDNSTATDSEGGRQAPARESGPPPNSSNRETRLKKRPKGDRWPGMMGDRTGPSLMRDERNA